MAFWVAVSKSVEGGLGSGRGRLWLERRVWKWHLYFLNWFSVKRRHKKRVQSGVRTFVYSLNIKSLGHELHGRLS